MKLRLMSLVATAGLLIALSGATMAQVKTEPGVARISMIHGDVSTQRGDSGDWGTAALNAPVVEGDRIQTGETSRVEVQLDYANILRLAERAQANINGLSRTQIQVQLGQGLANYSVLKNSDADVEIDTPNMSLHPTRREGNYRIFVLSDQETQIQIRRGEADIATPQGRTHVSKGQMIVVRGTGDDTQYKISDASSKDDFDRWTNDRDNTIRNAQAWTRTNDYYVGSEDLDAYGHWTSVPDYGQVWVPAVDYGWAPYRAGRWVWEPYWGWTWVSYEPWGWAPYHYGRWMYWGDSWVWWPGPVYGYRHYRPVWAPAYVSFFGFGGGGVGFAFGGGWGSIGWLPVGPCDGFYPWWGGYRSRFNVVNITNVTNVTNIYNVHNGAMPPLRTGTNFSNLHGAWNNDHIRRAISTVPSNDFGRGRATAQPISRENFRDVKMVAGNLPVVPNRESLFVKGTTAPVTTGHAIQNQRFFGTNRQPTIARQSFDRDATEVKTAIQRDGRFTPIVAGNQQGNAGAPNRAMQPTTPKTDIMRGAKTNEAPKGDVMRGATTNQAGNGNAKTTNQTDNGNANQSWRRFGQPERQTNPTTGTPANHDNNNRQPADNMRGKQTNNQNSDWRRFPSSGSSTPARPERGGSNVDNTPRRNSNPPEAKPAPKPDVRPAPKTDGNQSQQQWRKFDRTTSESGPRAMRGTTEAPASRDRQVTTTPAQDRGNDWRRFPSVEERNNSMSSSSRNSSAEPQRDTGNWRQMPAEQRQSVEQRQSDSGNWRQSTPRNNSGSYSRPQLDMRQPIVTPRSSAPSGGYHSSGGGGGSRPAPAPSHGGGGGGQPHPSGGGNNGSNGNSGPHRGR